MPCCVAVACWKHPRLPEVNKTPHRVVVLPLMATSVALGMKPAPAERMTCL
jgi:hypothetical protein